MAEQTLNNPLSGHEVIEAVLDRLRSKMQADCFLNANSAYDWFEADIKVKLDMHDAGMHVKADHEVTVKQGIQPQNDLQHVEADFHIDPAPPNTVRVDTGQPVPTLTKDEQGKEVVKGVRYARKDVKKAGKIMAMLLVCVGMTLGQAKTPAKAPTPTVTPSQRIAIEAIYAKNKKADADKQEVIGEMRQVEAEITSQHPGYHFDEALGIIVKDEAPVKK